MTLEDGPPDDAEDIAVGYRKPPTKTRFTKGRSGNLAGRPRGRHRQAPYESVLGQMVKIREGGAERHVTAAEAFLLQLRKRALEGDGAAARECLAMIEQAREQQGAGQSPITTIVRADSPRSTINAALTLKLPPSVAHWPIPSPVSGNFSGSTGGVGSDGRSCSSPLT